MSDAPATNEPPTTTRVRSAAEAARANALRERKQYERTPVAIAACMGGIVGLLATITLLNAGGLSGGAFWGAFVLAVVTVVCIVGFIIKRPRT